MDFLIRAMQPNDWERVKEIYNQAILEGESTFETKCPSYAAWDAAHLPDCRFVILTDNKIAGWCAISPTSSREAYRGVVEESVYIDKENRGKGLGRRLLEHLCITSVEKGYWSLYASIYANNTVSIALHKKCGFREIGYREKIAKDRFGKWQNTVLFEKRSSIE